MSTKNPKNHERCWGQTHAHTYSQEASWRRDSVWSESVFVCEENRSFLTISSSPLHKPLSSTGHVPFVQRTKWGSPALFVSAFMERYISASQLRWRKYADRRESADRYDTKAKRTVRGRFMDEAEGSQSIMPVALPLHYGNTRRPTAIYYLNFHSKNVWPRKPPVFSNTLPFKECQGDRHWNVALLFPVVVQQKTPTVSHSNIYLWVNHVA